MPTLREFLRVLCGEECDVAQLERRARELWPAEKVYVPQLSSRKTSINLALRRAVAEAAQTQDAGAVARRYGITRRQVRRLAEKAESGRIQRVGSDSMARETTPTVPRTKRCDSGA